MAIYREFENGKLELLVADTSIPTIDVLNERLKENNLPIQFCEQNASELVEAIIAADNKQLIEKEITK